LFNVNFLQGKQGILIEIGIDFRKGIFDNVEGENAVNNHREKSEKHHYNKLEVRFSKSGQVDARKLQIGASIS